MKKLKIQICDFWDQKETLLENDYLFTILKKRYKVELSLNPEIIFFSVFGNSYKEYLNQKRIFYTGENVEPNYNDCDYSLSFKKNSFVNIYLPNYIRHQYFQDFLKNNFDNNILMLRNKSKKRFCNFLYYNCNPKERIEFARLLNNYKKVDAPGRVLNNMPALNNRGDWIAKIQFLSDYKFTIAFENENSLNYTTEKIYHSLLVNSIPIYWGNPNVIKVFNPNSFINVNDYNSYKEVVNHIKYIDNNDQAYFKMLNSNPIIDNKETKQFQETLILERFNKFIISSKYKTFLRKTSYKIIKKLFNDKTY